MEMNTMKRFAAITLALILMFTFAVSVAAQESPIGKQYYKISVSAEGSGTATSSTNKVEKNTGDSVTLTATPDSGYFTRWIIDGDYELAEGYSITDPVIVIIPSSDINAISSFSIDPDYLSMFAEADTPGHDTAEVDIAKVEKGTETEVTFTATEVDSEFIEWEFFCDYKIVSGDLKSKVITIIPYTDVRGVAHFKQGAQPPKPDEGEDSPKTGDPLPYALPVMALAFGAAVVAAKKLKKD